MKKLLLLFLLITVYRLPITVLQAQNLVQNPSFEDTTGTGCPDGTFQSVLPIYWNSYSLTPDYFNACSPTAGYSSVPSNGWGYQNAFIGAAYCGAWFYQTIQPNTREYIAQHLENPLIIGQKYYVSFKISLAEISNCGINKIGMLFTTTSYLNYNNNFAPVTNHAQFFSTNIITDTLNWTNISGSFISDSAYQFLLISNFFNDSITDTTIVGPYAFYHFGAYYFIDDIYVGEDSLENIEPYGFQNIINIYPNPTSGILYVQKAYDKNFTWIVFDELGVEVKSGISEKIDLTECLSGVYYARIKFDKKIISKKIILIK